MLSDGPRHLVCFIKLVKSSNADLTNEYRYYSYFQLPSELLLK